MPVERILILPGMDGTGKLLLEFMAAHSLLASARKQIAVYPADAVLSYDQLATLVRSFCEESASFVLMAESFSTPLAIRIAAQRPANLQGLILCAGFAHCPVRAPMRWLAWLLSPFLLRAALPEFAIRKWLLGRDAPDLLVKTARDAIASVQPAVLSARLRSVLQCDARQELRRVDVPVLYLQARHDRLVSADSLDDIRAVKPDTRVAVLDGPHFLLQREPQRAAEAVTEFLSSFS